MKKCTTRERLIETAMDLIWTESYGSVGVEEMCRKAKIQKGSFYHFFPSKEDLAVAALTEAWEKIRPEIETLFSNKKRPLERLADYLDFAIKKQKELKKRFGFYPGCPYTALGMEQGCRHEKFRALAEKHLNLMKARFIETVEDASKEDSVEVHNPARAGSELFSLYLGAFVRLRITQNIGALRELKGGMDALLGITSKEKQLLPV